MSRWLVLGLLTVLAGCPPLEPTLPIPPISTNKVRVRVFTEPSAIRTIGSAGRFLFVATDNAVQRWDESGAVTVLSTDHGLTGDHVIALAPDPDRRWLWVLTDAGLGRYDTGSEIYSEVAAPPAALGIDYSALTRGGATLAPAVEDGVWIGTSKGLVFAGENGGWLAMPIRDPIRALVRDRAGWLWIATTNGLIGRKPNGDLVKLGPAQGCEVIDPRLLVEMPGDRVMVIGTDEQGRERLAIGRDTTWSSYRALPELAWDVATRRGDSVMVMGGDRVYRITPAHGGVRPLARDGVRLVPLASGGASEWMIDPVDLVVPPSATTIGSREDQLLIGTRDLGIARYREGDPHPRDWLRRREMFEDANTLSVACSRPQDCWVATGARQAWRWTGDRFVAGGPDQQVILAVARDPSGPIYALHRAPGDHEIHMSRIEGGTWTPLAKIALATPGDAPEVSFARFAASGTLWVGLRYHDGVDRLPYGIAIVEPGSGKVTYHRTETTEPIASFGGKQPAMWPVPVDVIDADVRGDTAWFATNAGVARLAGGRVRLWTEADGLHGDLARAVTIAQDGSVIVASPRGAEIWNGKAWSFPPALQFEINDVVATKSGQVWMATERGIAAWDGKNVRRVDTRRGLAENKVLDVAVDQFDRVWARGPGSLTLVSQ